MKPFTTIAVVVFTLVAFLHLLGWEVIIGEVVIPVWASYLGLLLVAGMAFMLW